MADKRKVSASTQFAALNAITFLYREVQKMEILPWKTPVDKTLSDDTGGEVDPRGRGDVSQNDGDDTLNGVVDLRSEFSQPLF